MAALAPKLRRPPNFWQPSVTANPMSNPPSAPQPAMGSTRSPSPKPATLPSTNRLSPSEIESLRQENKQAQEWMMAQLAKDK